MMKTVKLRRGCSVIRVRLENSTATGTETTPAVFDLENQFFQQQQSLQQQQQILQQQQQKV